MKGVTSVIIPTYNRRDFVVEALESVKNQASTEIEVIVVDDGSSDGTHHAIQAHGEYVKYVYQANAGLSTARNTGLRMASGEYIVFLDSDDLIDSDKVAHQASELRANPNIDVVYSQWLLRHVDSSEDDKVCGEDITKIIFPMILYNNFAPPHAFMFRKRALENVGGFDERLKACEDWDLLSRLVMTGYKFRFAPKVTCVYRMHKANISLDPHLMLDSRLKVVDKIFAHIACRSELIFALCQAIQYLDTVNMCAKLGMHFDFFVTELLRREDILRIVDNELKALMTADLGNNFRSLLLSKKIDGIGGFLKRHILSYYHY